MSEIIDLVPTVGFPIAMCAWFAFSFSRKIDGLSQEVMNLSVSIKDLTYCLKHSTSKGG